MAGRAASGDALLLEPGRRSDTPLPEIEIQPARYDYAGVAALNGGWDGPLGAGAGPSASPLRSISGIPHYADPAGKLRPKVRHLHLHLHLHLLPPYHGHCSRQSHRKML